MSEHKIETDRSGATWKVEVIMDRSCIDCIVDAGDDDMGGTLINRGDRMITIYNYELIDSATCDAEGNHV